MDSVFNDTWLASYFSSVGTILDYLRSSLPTDLAIDTTDAQLMAWYAGGENSSGLYDWMARGMDTCYNQSRNDKNALAEFCGTYGTAGSSDISGPGVSFRLIV